MSRVGELTESEGSNNVTGMFSQSRLDFLSTFQLLTSWNHFLPSKSRNVKLQLSSVKGISAVLLEGESTQLSAVSIDGCIFGYSKSPSKAK